MEEVSAAHAAEPASGPRRGDGPDTASVAKPSSDRVASSACSGFRADAVDVMHAGDVVCLTSAVEALPMSVLEAMSVGRP